jgi:OOP family OmpA-OmpF porin
MRTSESKRKRSLGEPNMKTCNPLRRAAWLLALSACAATPTLAKESGFYLGANIGEGTYDTGDAQLGVFTVVSGSEVDDSDLGFALTAGYRFNPYLGVELSFNDFGELEAVETGFGSTLVTPVVPVTTGGYADVKIGTRGLALAATGTFPLQDFELFGKVGVIRAETSLNTRVASTFGTLPTSLSGVRNETFEATTMLYGLGAGYNVNEEFNIKLEWMLVPKVAEEEDFGADVDVDIISIGFQFRF